MTTLFLKSLVIISGIAGTLCASVPVNLISNGGFESGLAGWPDLYLSRETDTTKATRIIDSTSNSAKEGKAFQRVIVTAATSMAWQFQLISPSLTAKVRYIYQFSMWARADSTRNAFISVYDKSSGWWDHRTGSEITLTTEWKQFREVWVSEGSGYGQFNFVFTSGPGLGVYDIDDVIIEEISNPEGSLYGNGGFELESAGWQFYVNSDTSISTAAAALTFPSGGAAEGERFARITVTSITSTELDWHIMLHDGSWKSVRNTEYRYSFQARADSIRPIKVVVQTGGSRFYQFLDEKSFSVTREWQPYSYTYCQDYYEPEPSLGPDSLNFVLLLGGSKGVYDFDAVSLAVPVSIDKKRSASHIPRNPCLSVQLHPGRLRCISDDGAVSPSIVSIFDIRGRVYSTFTIAADKRTFDLPRPPGGMWVIRMNDGRSGIVSVP